MWIFTRYGFYSVVAMKDDPDTVMIRARSLKHMTAIQDRFDWAFPVLEQLHSDYRYRIVVEKDQMAAAFMELAEEITWNNFKTEVKRYGATGRYLGALHNVWSDMMGFQRGA